MYRLLRKYHRWLAIVCALPLLLTVVTGITFPIAKALHQRQLAGFLIHLHTLEAFGLDTFFPIVNGLGLLGLLVTGIYMTSLCARTAFSLQPSRLLRSIYHDDPIPAVPSKFVV